MQSTLSQWVAKDGVTPKAVPALAPVPGLGSHVAGVLTGLCLFAGSKQCWKMFWKMVPLLAVGFPWGLPREK